MKKYKNMQILYPAALRKWGEYALLYEKSPAAEAAELLILCHTYFSLIELCSS